MTTLPRPVYVRQQTIPSKTGFSPHQHDWHQLLYAESGVLQVDVVGKRMFITPEKAVWLPCGCEHSVASEFGAELKSLYIEKGYQQLPQTQSQVFWVTPLTRQLILEAAEFKPEYPQQGYENDLINLLLRTLPRIQIDHQHLPWPVSTDLYPLCQQLYDNPGLRLKTEDLAKQLSVSKRTLERRFLKETGLPIQRWVQKLRFLKAVELLNAGHNITHIAYELGYSSPSAFIYMFREQSGVSPGNYLSAPAQEPSF
ncbi:MAG: helix-turn-helix transcriptional regulator [Motiliproteus sp.]|nr:helix-turn-helix transcriptional regulator [Motiliproteus sp.]